MTAKTDRPGGAALGSHGAPGVSRTVQLMSLIDRARHDSGFGNALRREPGAACATCWSIDGCVMSHPPTRPGHLAGAGSLRARTYSPTLRDRSQDSDGF